MAQHSRREFLERTTFTAAGLLAAGFTSSARGYYANETLNIGCIGTGGRWRGLMRGLSQVAGARVTAVCDVWDANLEAGKQAADSQAFATKDHRALLERKDVDAVVIATPDHWHCPLTIEACAAGKDVYVEKPLTHELAEGEAVVEAQNSHRRVVQVGMQQRSMPHIQEARGIVQSGQLGKILKAHLTWNRNQPRGRKTDFGIGAESVDWRRFLGSAKEQPFDAYRFREWRWFWDFGGGILTDLMTHHIDIVNWMLGLEHPAVATTIGDHVMNADLWETPDTVQTLLRYPEQDLQVYFEGTFSNARLGSMIELMGTEATLYIDRGRYEIIPERNKKIAAKEAVVGNGPRGADFYDKPDGEALHMANWIECIRSRERPNAPAEAGVSAAAAGHLGNIALRSGQMATWEANKPA